MSLSLRSSLPRCRSPRSRSRSRSCLRGRLRSPCRLPSPRLGFFFAGLKARSPSVPRPYSNACCQCPLTSVRRPAPPAAQAGSGRKKESFIIVPCQSRRIRLEAPRLTWPHLAMLRRNKRNENAPATTRHRSVYGTRLETVSRLIVPSLYITTRPSDPGRSITLAPWRTTG